MSRARIISRILRRKVRSGVSSRPLTICCVIVLPPCGSRRRPQVHPGGAQDRHEVDARVLEERAVLTGHEGPHHVVGHLLERGELAPLDVELAYQASVAVVDAARERRTVVLHSSQVREISEECEVEPDHGADARHREQTGRRQQDPHPTRPHQGHWNPGGSHDRSRGRAPCATASEESRRYWMTISPPHPGLRHGPPEVDRRGGRHDLSC